MTPHAFHMQNFYSGRAASPVKLQDPPTSDFPKNCIRMISAARKVLHPSKQYV